MKPEPRHCIVCGKVFTPPKRNEAKYCSKWCVWMGTKGPDYNAKIGHDYAEKSGNTQRGRGDGRGYRKFMGQHEHRVVAERILGRSLIKGEIVHHIDGNKLNNSPENLLVISRGEHMHMHGMGIVGIAPPWKPWEARWGKKGEKGNE